MPELTEENLDALIESLEEYRDMGVRDPWVLSDGTIIELLDILLELKKLRHDRTGIH